MVASFGERLKREREKRGMTLEEVAGVTKISVRNLRALEEEKFELMPGGIFNRGFVRSYAKHLGLDDQQVVADYREAAGESVSTPDAPDTPSTPQKDAPAQAEARPTDVSAQVPWAALVGLVVFGTILLAVWSYHAHHKASDQGAEAVATQGTPVASGEAPHEVVPPDAKGAPNTATSDLAATGATQAPAAGASGNASVAKTGFDLSLRARDEVWVSTAVDGKPPSEAIMEDGQSIAVHALDRAILRVGNSAAVDIAFNGQKVKVHGVEGEPRNLTFTSSGLQVPEPATPRPN